MKADKRQLRTTNNKGLLGYRGKYHGKNVIAIMKGKDCKECLGIIYPEQLEELINSGPYIDLDNIYQ